MGRSSARCPGCGAQMPGAALYCPACGAASGELRVEPIGGEAEAAPVEVDLGRRRWLAPAVIAAVVALVAVVVTVGGSGSNEPAASPTTSAASTTTSTVAPTTSTRPARSTTTTMFSQFAAPPLPAAAGVVVYMSTQEGEVYRIDLGSGDVQRRQMELEERRGGPWVVLARQGGFVMADASYDDQTPVYGVVDGADGAAVPIGDWQSVENYGSLMPRVAPAAEPDEVWVWNDSINGQAVVVKRVRLDGTVTAGPVTLPRYGTVFGADGPGAVALRSDRGLYRATIIGQDVQIEPISPRVPLAYSTAALLDLECDGALQCQVVVVDRATGTVRPVPGTVTDEVVPSYDLTLSGDGRWLANVVYDGPNSPELTVYDLTTGEALIRDSVIPKSYGFLGTPQSAEFTTDGKWLVFFTIDGGIRLWPVGSAGGVVSFSVPGVMNVNTVSVAP